MSARLAPLACLVVVTGTAACFDFDEFARRLQDAGAPDASVALDASIADLGVAGCAGSTMLLCDDFEEGSLSSLWESAPSLTASIAVEAGHAFEGSYALHLSSQAVDAGSSVTTNLKAVMPLLPQPQLWLRAYLYLVGDTPSGQDLEVFSLGSTGTQVVRLMVRSDHPLISTSFPDGGGSSTSAVTLATDKWVCVEWLIDTATPNRVRVLVDGQGVPDLDLALPTDTSPPLEVFKVYIAMYNAGMSIPAYDYYIDDLAIDGAQIGCAR